MTVCGTPLARMVFPTMSRRAAVPIPPEVVTQQHDGLGAGPIVAVAEAAAQDGLDAERLERADRELAAAESLRPPFLRGQVERREPERAEFLERRLPRLPDRQVLHADGLAGLVLGSFRRDQGDDAIGVRERQALEQPAVDDAEDRRAEADAQAERQNGDQRQRRVLDEHPDAGAQVGPEVVHPYQDVTPGRDVRGEIRMRQRVAGRRCRSGL